MRSARKPGKALVDVQREPARSGTGARRWVSRRRFRSAQESLPPETPTRIRSPGSISPKSPIASPNRVNRRRSSRWSSLTLVGRPPGGIARIVAPPATPLQPTRWPSPRAARRVAVAGGPTGSRAGGRAGSVDSEGAPVHLNGSRGGLSISTRRPRRAGDGRQPGHRPRRGPRPRPGGRRRGRGRSQGAGPRAGRRRDPGARPPGARGSGPPRPPTGRRPALRGRHATPSGASTCW